MPQPFLGPLPVPEEADILEAAPPPTERELLPGACREGECLRLRHVLVERLLEDESLGLLLQGISIVGFGSAQAEDAGWRVGDQIVEINGRRVGAFEEFLHHFAEAQEEGFPIDFSVLRHEAAAEPWLEAGEALDGFFGATDLESLAGLMRRKFGQGRERQEAIGLVLSEEDDGHGSARAAEAITDNPYIQALVKRREDLSKTAEGWALDEDERPLAVQLATQPSGGLATLTVEQEEAGAAEGQRLGWDCATGGSQRCSKAVASMGTSDIQPTPRADLDMAVAHEPTLVGQPHSEEEEEDLEKRIRIFNSWETERAILLGVT